MATSKKSKAPKEVLQDKDNPSLCEVGGVIHLRVFEDFFCETNLPKWKDFKQKWEDLKKKFKVSWDNDMENVIKKLESGKVVETAVDDKPIPSTDELKKAVADHKKVEDDRYHIREKHEREVAESLKKCSRLSVQPTFWDKIKNKLGMGPKILPVEIAFSELKSHLLQTSTEALAQQAAILTQAENTMRDAGQYNKADVVKEYRTHLAYEKVLVDSGFTTYLDEEQLIEFIKKSERGTMVDFIRYYDGVIPPDVIEKKKAADQLMIFDNYVVVHYTSVMKAAKKAEKRVEEDTVKKERAKRRDPILFGMIKESRKLFFIADWVDESDDLTLEVIEKALGITRNTLTTSTPLTTFASTRSNNDISTDTNMNASYDYYTNSSAVGQNAQLGRFVRQIVYSQNNDSSF